MSTVALLFAGLLQASSSTHPVLEAFKAHCIPERSSMAALTRALEGSGWVRAGAQDHPELAWELRQPPVVIGSDWREATGFTTPQRRIDWVRGVGPRRLFLTQLEFHHGDWTGGGYDDLPAAVEVTTFMACTVSDFESTAPIRPELVSAWVGGQPTVWNRDSGGFEHGDWDVSGRLVGADTVSTSHAPTGAFNGASEATRATISSTVGKRQLPIRADYQFPDDW